MVAAVEDEGVGPPAAVAPSPLRPNAGATLRPPTGTVIPVVLQPLPVPQRRWASEQEAEDEEAREGEKGSQ